MSGSLIAIALAMAMLLVMGAEARYSPGLEIAASENITLSGGHLAGSVNPPGDAEIYIYSNGGYTISEWANGTAINTSASPHLAIESAITALSSGGSISLRNSFTVTNDIDITESNIHIYGNGHTITAGAGCTGAVFLIDSVGEGKSINGFWLCDCIIRCADIAANAVSFTGHFGSIPNGFHRLESVYSANATSSTYNFNATSDTYLYDISSWYSDGPGILFEEGCVNNWITKYESQSNQRGLQIGSNVNSPHHRCEGIVITDSLFLDDITPIYIKGVLYADISHSVIDHFTGEGIYIEGDSDGISIVENWISGITQTYPFNSINLNPASAIMSNIRISDNNIFDAGYCGLKVSYVDRLVVSGNSFSNNARLDTGGADILLGACTNTIVTGNFLATTAGNYSIYSGWESNGLIFSLNEYADVIYIGDSSKVNASNLAIV